MAAFLETVYLGILVGLKGFRLMLGVVWKMARLSMIVWLGVIIFYVCRTAVN